MSNLQVETPGIVSHRDTNCSFGLAKGWCRTAVSSKSTACCGTVCAGWDCTCGVFLRRATRATPEYCGSLMQIKREPLDLLEVRHLTGHLNSKNASWCDKLQEKGCQPRIYKHKHKLHEAPAIGPATHLLCKIQCQPRPTKPEGALDTRPAAFKSWMCLATTWAEPSLAPIFFCTSSASRLLQEAPSGHHWVSTASVPSLWSSSFLLLGHQPWLCWLNSWMRWLWPELLKKTPQPKVGPWGSRDLPSSYILSWIDYNYYPDIHKSWNPYA